MINYKIKKCDVADIMLETIRFLSHITLLHILNYTVNENEGLFTITFLRTLLFTCIAIILYQLIIKQLFIKFIKKMKKYCNAELAIEKEYES